MKWALLILSVIVLSCDSSQWSGCYGCETVTRKELCSGPVETTTIVEEFCEWTGEQKQQYEAKNTFSYQEKCFTLHQTCKCYKLWN